jgi:hypothetical protein
MAHQANKALAYDISWLRETNPMYEKGVLFAKKEDDKDVPKGFEKFFKKSASDSKKSEPAKEEKKEEKTA